MSAVTTEPVAATTEGRQVQAYVAGVSQAVEPRRHSRRTLLIVAVGLAFSSMSAAAGSLALFTDSAVVGANGFVSGEIDIDASPATALVSYTDMMPGDNVTGTLTVSNAGGASLRYAMTSASTNVDGKNLRDVVSLEVRTQGTSCAAFDGTSLYSGALGVAAFGNPSAGAQAGDRTLSGGASEVLCFKASLPLGTGDAYQNAATTTTFTFQAEQTANNP